MSKPFVTYNGYSGTESAKRTTSLLAQLLVYIATVQKNGGRPTRIGFAAFIGRAPSDTFATNLLIMAKQNDYVRETGQRIREGKVLTLGPNARNTAVMATLQDMGAFTNE